MEISVQPKRSVFISKRFPLIKGSRSVPTFTRIFTISEIFNADDKSGQRYVYNQIMF